MPCSGAHGNGLDTGVTEPTSSHGSLRGALIRLVNLSTCFSPPLGPTFSFPLNQPSHFFLSLVLFLTLFICSIIITSSSFHFASLVNLFLYNFYFLSNYIFTKKSSRNPNSKPNAFLQP